jgi:2-polyprenyl-3-methyl-5-hydroxy-6-metoxy-1,4-benzoquinol methylase
MHHWLIEILACPNCRENVPLVLSQGKLAGEEIIEGNLKCETCAGEWPVVRGIPRFVKQDENYAENFSYEWARWGRVQIDRFAGHTLSRDRFLADSKWQPDWLRDKLILDAGCGAGRFVDVAAQLGARVIAVDLSEAVDSCRSNMEIHGARVQVVQASLYALPLKKDAFDGLYCMGVIQHTPAPEKTVCLLPDHLKPGGRLAYNWYEVTWFTKLQPIKYALRWITPHLPVKVLHWMSLLLTILLFPVTWLLRFIPKVRILNIAMPICACHYDGLTLKQQFVWTLLDTFDWYSPRYELRQRKQRIRELLSELGLMDVAVADGLGWARKTRARSPLDKASPSA